MNILAFSNCPLDPMLGSGKTRLAWSAGLCARGHQVRVLDSVELLGAEETSRRAGGHRWRLASRAWRWLSALPPAAWREIDLVEFYGAEFWLPMWWAGGRNTPRPLLVAHTDGLEPLATVRLRAGGAEDSQPLWRTWASEGCSRLAFTRADALVVGCEADRRFALDRGLVRDAGRAVTVAPGLDEEFLRAANDGDGGGEAGAASREQRVAFLGSWIPRKGIRHLVAVMDGLMRERPGLRLSVGGMGPRISAGELLEAFAPDLRARVDVLPAGAPTVTCVEMLSRARVFFFPSEYEGFGLALAEAMACGCAAVTTPTGLGADLRDGEEALVCPFGDRARMRAAIARLLDDETLRARLAAAGRRRVRELRWDGAVRRLEATYERWLAEHRPRGGDVLTERRREFAAGR